MDPTLCSNLLHLVHLQQKSHQNLSSGSLRKVWLRGPDLNRQPSDYEPDELPDCSTPRYCVVKWWREKDSNLRRRRQQIYSLPPLASLGIPPRKTLLNWSRWRKLNPQPLDYKSSALPIELHRRNN